MKMYNIAHALKEAARLNPDRIALIDGKRSHLQWTFSQVENAMNFYAHSLEQRGIQRGSRVMLMVKPSMEFIGLSFALFAIGAVVILIDPGMGYKNLLKCIGSVKPEALIGIAKAHIFKKLFPAPFRTVRTNICITPTLGLFGSALPKPTRSAQPYPVHQAAENELAAIIFTTGSTGPPKGVQYEHSIFIAQLDMIRHYYGIQPGDVDQPAFPLFALFSIGLGATAIIPDMDPTRPARVNPKKFIDTINRFGVTYSFGSPAIWKEVSSYCLARNIRLSTLNKVLMAGAPVPGNLIKGMQKILPQGGEVHTPYGATECLPIVSITGSEIVESTWPLTKNGKGTCVGRPLPDIELKIIAPEDGPISGFEQARLLPLGEVGEIIVCGRVVTRAYDNNPAENTIAKIKDGNKFWHRIGDMGYLDNQGRLWFCGRKAHRVLTRDGVLYSVCCEAVFNNHPQVNRSALVAIGPTDNHHPVLIVEPYKKIGDQNRLFDELGQIARTHRHTTSIKRFLLHPSFPVDIRHNAKIFREKLASWAEEQC